MPGVVLYADVPAACLESFVSQTGLRKQNKIGFKLMALLYAQYL